MEPDAGRSPRRRTAAALASGRRRARGRDRRRRPLGDDAGDDPGEISDFASLVVGAPDLRIVYTGFAPPYGEHRTYWRRLDATGAAAAPAVELERDPYGFGIGARAVALGDEAVVSLDESSVLLRVARVTSAGQITTPAQDVATSPFFYSAAVARRGPEVVFGWLSPLGIGLARIAP